MKVQRAYLGTDRSMGKMLSPESSPALFTSKLHAFLHDTVFYFLLLSRVKSCQIISPLP